MTINPVEKKVDRDLDEAAGAVRDVRFTGSLSLPIPILACSGTNQAYRPLEGCVNNDGEQPGRVRHSCCPKSLTTCLLPDEALQASQQQNHSPESLQTGNHPAMQVALL